MSPRNPEEEEEGGGTMDEVVEGGV